MSNKPIVKFTVHTESDIAQTICNTFQSVFHWVCKIINRINAPFIASFIVMLTRNFVHNRVAHQNVWVTHVNFCTQSKAPVWIFARFHFTEQTQIFFCWTITVRAVFARLGECAFHCLLLFLAQFINICIAFHNHFFCNFINLVKICFRRKNHSLWSVTQPFQIFQITICKFALFTAWICVIHTKICVTTKFDCSFKVNHPRFAVPDVPVAAWFRWATSDNFLASARF